MQKSQIFEEFKSKILTKISTNKELPTECINILKESFNDMFKVCTNTSDAQTLETLKTYMQGNFDMLKVSIKKLEEDRNSAKLDSVWKIVNQIENEIENNEDDANRTKTQIDDVQLNNASDATNMIDMTADYLRDAQDSFNKMLEIRGYSQQVIEGVNEKINNYISHFTVQTPDKITEILQEDQEILKKEIAEEYNGYLQEVKYVEGEKQEDTTISRQEQFRQELDSGITLEEQKDFVDKFNENQENSNNKEEKNQNKDLPGDIIF